MKKSELRSTLLAKRQTLAADAKKTMDERIGERLLAWLPTTDVTLVGVYWPMRGEPDLDATFAVLHDSGTQLALPVVVSKDDPLKFIAWMPGEPMKADRYGVMTPAARHREVFPQLLVIPCVGFNRHCFRLGYGGGFYDRTVALKPRPKTVGVTYSFSEVVFAPDTYDIALDVLLTEEGQLP